MTPPQTALGEAGGFGFSGPAGVVREKIARVIAELTGGPLPDAGARAALAAAAPPLDPARGGGTQDDDPDN